MLEKINPLKQKIFFFLSGKIRGLWQVGGRRNKRLHFDQIKKHW